MRSIKLLLEEHQAAASCSEEPKEHDAAATSAKDLICGLKLLVYSAFGYQCMRPSTTSVCGLELLVYAALSNWCMRPEATSVRGLKLQLYESLSYWCMRPYATSVYEAFIKRCTGVS